MIQVSFPFFYFQTSRRFHYFLKPQILTDISNCPQPALLCSISSPCMVPRTAESAGKLLEMQIPRSHSGPTASENLGWGAATCILTSPPHDSEVCSRLKAASIQQVYPSMLWQKHITAFTLYRYLGNF